MSLKTKLAIAFSISIVLVVGICFWGLRGRGGPRSIEPGADPAAAPAVSRAADRKAPGAAEKTQEAGDLAENAADAAAISPPPSDGKGGWTLTGRVVRIDETSTPLPVEKVPIWLRRHPRRTKPEEFPKPYSVPTAADGRFELHGVPGNLWLRVEIDEPTSAYRALSFRLGDPGADDRKDLGDIVLEAGLALQVDLIGPKGEPVEKGTVLVGREESSRASASEDAGFKDSRREADEKGKGVYVLSRTGPGPHSLRISAPGCSPARDNVTLPREEPVVIHLAEGHRLAGVVLDGDDKPIAGAVVEVKSGPNLSEPRPEAKTDADGKFAIDCLSDGSFEIAAEADGHAAEKKKGVPADTEELEFRLPREAIIAGKVVSEADGSPIVKASVSAKSIAGDSFDAKTDERGAFRIPKVRAGTYTITADHADFAKVEEEPREIQLGERVAGLVLKLPSGLAATGNVLDADTGAPVKDAQVYFQLTDPTGGQGKAVQRSGKTAAEGTFEVRGLAEGSYKLSARAKGYLPAASQSIQVKERGKREYSVTLLRGAYIAGRVLDAKGTPVIGAVLKARLNFTTPDDWNKNNQLVQSAGARSDSEGKYSLEGLPPHAGYKVTATHEEFAPGSTSGIEVKDREAVEGVDVVLIRGGTIRGRVLDAKGDPIPGANVQAAEEKKADPAEDDADGGFRINFPGQGPATRNVTSEADGSFALAHLSPGSYSVKAQSRDRASASRKQIAVADEATVDGVDLVLGEGEAITGRVVDAVTGEPIPGARVEAYGEENTTARVDADGRFELKGLRKGDVQVGASENGYQRANVETKAPARDLVLKLEKSAHIRGTVRSKAQGGFKNMQVMAFEKRGEGQPEQPVWSSQFGQDSTDGAFDIEVKAGSYVIRAAARGFPRSESGVVGVKAGQTLEGVTIDLQAGGSISGVVLVAGSGEPISGASISLRVDQRQQQWDYGFGRPSAQTGADGSFTLEGVPAGLATIDAMHQEYANGAAEAVAVREGETATVRIELAAGGGIRGVVMKGGAPVKGWTISASPTVPQTNGVWNGKQASTDSQGRFEMKGLAAGTYMLQAFKWNRNGQGTQGGTRTVTVTEGQVTEVEWSEEAGVRVAGTVRADGAPVAGGQVEAIRLDSGSGGPRGSIDGSGGYSIDLPGPGKYLFMIDVGGRGGVRVDVTVPSGVTEHRQDIDLPGGEVRGIVVDAATGEPVARAEVIAFDGPAAMRSLGTMFAGVRGHARSGTDGRFAVRALGQGTYTLVANAQGYASGQVAARVDGRGAGKEVSIALEAEVALSVRVVGPGGEPVAQATAVLRDEGGNLIFLRQPAVSGAAGEMALAGLRTAVYQVTVVHPAYAPGRATIEASQGAPEATVQLQAGGRLVVRVTDRRRKPIEGAEVHVVDEQGYDVIDDMAFASFFTQKKGVLTGPDGTLVLDHIAEGRYRVSAAREGARSREERVDVRLGADSEARVVLEE